MKQPHLRKRFQNYVAKKIERIGSNKSKQGGKSLETIKGTCSFIRDPRVGKVLSESPVNMQHCY